VKLDIGVINKEDGIVSEERLNEIKDSINFQKELLLAHNMNTLCVDEEQELIEEIDRLNNIIKELSKDVDMWNKKYNEQFDIINELEKWLEDNLGNCRTNQNYTSNQIYNLKEDTYYRCLDKLKELKENNNV
jgi:predicted  nucleic acid-binding Zn-ribbon protein